MTEPIKLAVLGGSGVATPDLVEKLVAAGDRCPAIHVALLGRTADKLEKVGRFARQIAERAGAPITVSTHTDLAEGLEGADYVLNQIRVGGYAARAIDETFPRAFGIPGEETFGPGGMNNALRTIPVVLDLCRAIERAAPDALLLNLTNPAGMVQYAISRYTDLNAVSICDSPLWMGKAVAAFLGRDYRKLRIRYVGMNHFGWIVEVCEGNHDLMPEVMAKIAEFPGLPIEAEIASAIGAVPHSYFKYYYHADRMLATQQDKPARAEQLIALEAEILAAYESGDLDAMLAALKRRGANWYEGIIIPVMLAQVHDENAEMPLNVTNGSVVPFLPPEAIVEVPCLVSRACISPLALTSPVAPDIQAMLVTNAAFEMLWVEAVVERDYPKALRALMANHLVHTYDQAKGLLEEMWPEEWR
jgi:6-phospho-beta-glucosidase